MSATIPVGPAPTKGASEDNVWAAHPTRAMAVRFVVFAAPIVVSFLVTRAAMPALWRPDGWIGLVVFVAQVAAIGSAAALLMGRLVKRFLPLASLLNMTLVFPDRAPSRFGVALKSGTVNKLKRSFDEGPPSDHQEAAEWLVAKVAELGRHERLTRGHTERVRAYSDMIAREMGMSDEDRGLLGWSALIHDLGKLTVPAEILQLPGRPNDEQWEILRRHPQAGADMVEPLAAWLGDWRLAARDHHERWDGKGYPNGLAGSDISLAGRIVAVADAFDVITSTRSYKAAMTNQAARAEMVRCAGGQFDPDIVRYLLRASLMKDRASIGFLGWITELGRASAIPQTVASSASAVATTAVVSTAAVVSGGAIVADPDPRPEPEQAVTVEMDEQAGPVGDLAFAEPNAAPPLGLSELDAGLGGLQFDPVESTTTTTSAPSSSTTQPTTPEAGQQSTSSTTVAGQAATSTTVTTAVKAVATTVAATPTTEKPVTTTTAATTTTASITTTTAATTTTSTTTTTVPTTTTTAPTTTTTEAGPMAETYYLGSGGRSSSYWLLPLNEDPADGSLPNYDTDRDDDPGLKIKRGDGLGETSGDKRQMWTASYTGGPVSGSPVVDLYLATKDFKTDKVGRVAVGVYVCNSWGLSCSLASSTEVDVNQASFGSDFGKVTATLPTIGSVGSTTGWMTLVVAPVSASDSDIWMAYGTSRYPSGLRLE